MGSVKSVLFDTMLPKPHAKLSVETSKLDVCHHDVISRQRRWNSVLLGLVACLGQGLQSGVEFKLHYQALIES